MKNSTRLDGLPLQHHCGLKIYDTILNANFVLMLPILKVNPRWQENLTYYKYENKKQL